MRARRGDRPTARRPHDLGHEPLERLVPAELLGTAALPCVVGSPDVDWLRACRSRSSTTGTGDAIGEANAEPMGNETRLERWLDRALARAATPRGGATVIATITTIATVGFGLLMTTLDHQNFTTVGQGLWWAVQTVTTVGYGDHVPTNTAGRLVAAAVMLLGLAFLAVITAAITSSFVARATEERTRRGGAAPATEHDMRDINERLDRMEGLLRERF
jgi:voltage-gated potassium channel